MDRELEKLEIAALIARPLPLALRRDARRVNHKVILEDSSPWNDIALRDWEDAETA